MTSVDTTGAGDSFDAGFLAAWLDGRPLRGACGSPWPAAPCPRAASAGRRASRRWTRRDAARAGRVSAAWRRRSSRGAAIPRRHPPHRRRLAQRRRRQDGGRRASGPRRDPPPGLLPSLSRAARPLNVVRAAGTSGLDGQASSRCSAVTPGRGVADGAGARGRSRRVPSRSPARPAPACPSSTGPRASLTEFYEAGVHAARRGLAAGRGGPARGAAGRRPRGPVRRGPPGASRRVHRPTPTRASPPSLPGPGRGRWSTSRGRRSWRRSRPDRGWSRSTRARPGPPPAPDRRTRAACRRRPRRCVDRRGGRRDRSPGASHGAALVVGTEALGGSGRRRDRSLLVGSGDAFLGGLAAGLAAGHHCPMPPGSVGRLRAANALRARTGRAGSGRRRSRVPIPGRIIAPSARLTGALLRDLGPAPPGDGARAPSLRGPGRPRTPCRRRRCEPTTSASAPGPARPRVACAEPGQRDAGPAAGPPRGSRPGGLAEEAPEPLLAGRVGLREPRRQRVGVRPPRGGLDKAELRDVAR